jgi:hypothetical protein
MKRTIRKDYKGYIVVLELLGDPNEILGNYNNAIQAATE